MKLKKAMAVKSTGDINVVKIFKNKITIGGPKPNQLLIAFRNGSAPEGNKLK